MAETEKTSVPLKEVVGRQLFGADYHLPGPSYEYRRNIFELASVTIAVTLTAAICFAIGLGCYALWVLVVVR